MDKLETKIKETHLDCGGEVKRIRDAPPEMGDHYALQFRYKCLKCGKKFGRGSVGTEYL